MKKNFGINSKIEGNTKTFWSLSLILLLSTTLLMAFAQPSLAQVGVPQPEKTVGYISVAPTVVGVDQEATVNLWVFPLPTTYYYQPYFKGFFGVTVTFVKPDGTKDTFMPVDGTGQFIAGEMQSLGAIYFSYAPDMPGNWSVTYTMPAQNITDSSGTVLYTGCTSNTAYFTVQTDHVNAGLLDGYPWSQLPNPNVYWSYPINSNNREWSQISGDWLSPGTTSGSASIYGVTTRLWQPYGSAPNAAHIVWTQPIRPGGIIGGDYGSLSYGYAVGATGVMVMMGKLFVNVPNANQFECIDLATGNVLYEANGSITCGLHVPGNAYSQTSNNNQVLLENSFGNDYVSYIYQSSGTTWNYYDPSNGALVRSITNASSARLVDGTMLAYGASSGNLYRWNMSKVVNNNWPTGITWTRPLPTPIATGLTVSLFGMTSDVIVVSASRSNQFWGFSATDGASLWNLTLTYPVLGNEAITLYGVPDFVIFDPVAGAFNCYSITNGALLWTSPSFSSSPWATTWTVYTSLTNDNNNLYIQFPDGTMTALSLATGKQLWRSQAIASTEFTENANPYWIGMVMAGGNIYGYAGYSINYQANPIPRLAMLVCINATTGDITWTLNGGVWPSAAANGYVAGYGIYDGNIYCLGKGQTTTAVTAQQQVGGSVLIQGSVLDKSAAQPNTAAISDANMSVWMDFMHMQNSTLLNSPPECTGVPVTLTAVDPNGNKIDLGTTTSNYQGNYGFQWTPTNPGLYTIYATFAGSNSYYSSSASTYATIASSTTSSPTPTANLQPIVSNSDIVTYLAVGVIAIIVAIAIVGALLLRKRS